VQQELVENRNRLFLDKAEASFIDEGKSRQVA
jgi:hypothetical protein